MALILPERRGVSGAAGVYDVIPDFIAGMLVTGKPKLGLVLLLALLAWLPAYAQTNLPALLEQASNDGLSLAEQQALLDRVFAELNDATPADTIAEAHRLQARVLLASGRVQEGIVVLDDALANLTRSQAPGPWVRLKSGRASLLLASGDAAAAVVAHEELLAMDNSDVAPEDLLKVQGNYASSLHEAGQVLAASEAYYQVIPQALAQNDARTALIMGNNLVVLLMSRRLYEDARDWLIRLKPMREESSYAALVNSLQLHEWELQRIFGDPEGAAEQLRNFLVSANEDHAAIVGSAHEFLADALRESGDLEASEAEATQAVSILAAVPFELPDAQIALVRTLLAREDFAAAAEELEKIAQPEDAPAYRRSNLASLKLEVELRQRGLDAAAAEVQRLVQSLQAENRQDSVQYVRYYDAKLLAEQQQSEIERIKLSEARLADEAQDAAARARVLEQRQETLRQNRNLTVAVITLAAAALMLMAYLVTRRAYQRKLLTREQEQNRELAAQVAEKSEALSRQLEEQAELQQALDRKKQAELIGQLTGNVAHDFNNLLQVIANSNEQLADEASSADACQMLKASNDSVQYARAMIQQLLAYARQQKLRARAVDVFRLLQDNHTLLRSAAGEAVRVNLMEPTGKVTALVDPAQLSTGLLNLVRNAADAMQAGGSIQISISPMSEAAMAEWSLQPGDYLLIEVADDGEGMSDEALEKACEPFFTTKPEGHGTGLGLSSVYGFASQSGGGLKIHSTPGAGTTVSVALPAVNATATPLPKSREQLDPQLASQRVLLVEDNALVARTVDTILRSAGAQVDVTSSADEARARLETESEFDVLLTDIRMPGEMDGYGLAEWATQQFPHMRVLLMSGFNEPADRPLDLPMIAKPFTRQQLMAALVGD
ncbi:MAG: ATP-binding protein [Pseudomonadota bacterium]